MQYLVTTGDKHILSAGRALVLISLVLTAILSDLLHADAPTTTQAIPVEQVTALVNALADPNASQRLFARERLFDLSPDDLPALMEVVKQSQPLLPAQATALKEIVLHVYARSLSYATATREGFLGIRFEPQNQFEENASPIIVGRIPGFIAYAKLRDGDVVKSFITPSGPVAVANNKQVADWIKQARPGQILKLEIQRQNQILRVSMPADPRPGNPLDPRVPGVVDNQLEEICNLRITKAQDYWLSHFAPLIITDAR